MKKQMEYGYARESSKDKEAEVQIAALQEAGILPENLFVDQPSEKDRFRQVAERIRLGDVLVIKSLSQLGYNYQEILNEWNTLTSELGACVRVLDIAYLDTSVKRQNPDGAFVSELFLQIINFVAQQERLYIKRRQAEGIAYARLQGRHLGRPRIVKPLNFDDTYDAWRAGRISAEEAMVLVKLKRSTFERFVKERKEELRRESEQKAS